MRLPRRLSAASLPLAAALAATLLALAPVPRAVAATLQVAGPAGARVTLNGSFIGFLPLSGPLTLPAGTFDLTCEMPGMITHHQRLDLTGPGDWRHVTVRLLPYRRRTAVLSNVVLAGLGPRYLGHGTRAWMYSAAEVGGLVFALGSEVTRSNAQKDYVLALDAAALAVDPGEIASLRAAADAKYQDARHAASRRDMGLTVALGAVVVSMVDAWLSFDGVTAGAGEVPGGGPRVSLGPGASTGPSFHSAVRLRF